MDESKEDEMARWSDNGKSRAWCFTLNNYSNRHMQELLEWSLPSWIIFGQEQGASGTPHLQGYARFPNAVRRSTLSKLNARIHWGIAKCGPEFNYMYCTKGEGVFNRETKEWVNHGLNANVSERGTRPSFNKHIQGILYNLSTILEHLEQCQCGDTVAHDILQNTMDEIYMNDDLIWMDESQESDSKDFANMLPLCTFDSEIELPVCKRLKTE